MTTKTRRKVRHQFPNAWLQYNGAARDYEDAADYIRLTDVIKAVRIG